MALVPHYQLCSTVRTKNALTALILHSIIQGPIHIGSRSIVSNRTPSVIELYFQKGHSITKSYSFCNSSSKVIVALFDRHSNHDVGQVDPVC